MIGNFKDFYKFVKCFNPRLCNIWEDFYNRADPKRGDEYIYNNEKIIFDNVVFDSYFKNGVAFYYNFYNLTGDKISIHSINNVYDPDKLTKEDIEDLYGFWTKCYPY